MPNMQDRDPTSYVLVVGPPDGAREMSILDNLQVTLHPDLNGARHQALRHFSVRDDATEDAEVEQMLREKGQPVKIVPMAESPIPVGTLLMIANDEEKAVLLDLMVRARYKWRCEKCGAINEHGTKRCEKCLTPRA